VILEFREIAFGSEDYKKEVELRYEVLRKPLGLVFDPAVLALEGSDNHLCAFTNDHKLIACLLMVPLAGGKVKMRQFAVDPQYQGKGVGTGLVAFAEEWSVQKGFKRIELNARKNAVPFYLKLNYIKEGDEFIEVTIPHYFMYKNLVVGH